MALFTWKAEAGAATFGGLVDPSGQIDEDNEDNNRLTVDFGGAFISDLVIDQLTWSPVVPSVKDRVTFTVGVKNQGLGASEDSRVHVFFDSKVNPEWNLPLAGVDGGETKTASFSWTADTATHTFRLVADATKVVTETNELNNEATANYNATELADLVVDKVTRAPVNPSIGEDVIYSVTVKNEGKGSSVDFQVNVLFDGGGNPKWELKFSGIAAGQSAVRTFTWTVQTGTHTFKFVADSGVLVPETDESNNEATVLFP